MPLLFLIPLFLAGGYTGYKITSAVTPSNNDNSNPIDELTSTANLLKFSIIGLGGLFVYKKYIKK